MRCALASALEVLTILVALAPLSCVANRAWYDVRDMDPYLGYPKTMAPKPSEEWHKLEAAGLLRILDERFADCDRRFLLATFIHSGWGGVDPALVAVGVSDKKIKVLSNAQSPFSLDWSEGYGVSEWMSAIRPGYGVQFMEWDLEEMDEGMRQDVECLVARLMAPTPASPLSEGMIFDYEACSCLRICRGEAVENHLVMNPQFEGDDPYDAGPLEKKIIAVRELQQCLLLADATSNPGYAPRQCTKQLGHPLGWYKGYSANRYPVEVGLAWGYIDGKGEMVIPPQFEDADFFDEGLAPVKLNGKWGFINPAGKMVIEAKYDGAEYFSEGLAPVKLNGKWGFIDPRGTLVGEASYDEVEPFSEGLAAVRQFKGSTWSYITPTGEEAFRDRNFSEARAFSEGLAAVKVGSGKVHLGGLWGYINKKGYWVVEPRFLWATDFSEGLGLVEDNGLYGFLDKEGKYVFKPQAEDARSFSEGRAGVFIGKRWRYIDRTGAEVIRLPESVGSGYFQGGLAKVFALVKNEKNIDMLKAGFLDTSGAWAVQPEFDVFDTSEFSGGLARAKMFGQDKVGFIDQRGQWVIPARFEWASLFVGDLARVKEDGLSGYINRKGEYVWRQAAPR